MASYSSVLPFRSYCHPLEMDDICVEYLLCARHCTRDTAGGSSVPTMGRFSGTFVKAERQLLLEHYQGTFLRRIKGDSSRKKSCSS